MRREATAALFLCAVTAVAVPAEFAAAAGMGGDAGKSTNSAIGGVRPRGLVVSPRAAPNQPHVDCRRWQLLTSYLGETLAGRRLRQTMTGDLCRQSGQDAASIWDWPWSGGALSATLPPRVVADSGRWQVRCATVAGLGQRCALVHQFDPVRSTSEPSGQGLDWAATDRDEVRAGLSTHFIIDTVAGRERVIWRVFVPASQRDPALSELSRTDGQTAPTPDTRLADSEARKQRRWEGPVLRVADEPVSQTAPGYCTAVGCLLEAAPRQSTVVANRLIESSTIAVRIEGVGSWPTIEVSLPATGFRAGFAELVSQRRAEARGSP
jgi:invasion protein IalB